MIPTLTNIGAGRLLLCEGIGRELLYAAKGMVPNSNHDQPVTKG